MTETEQKTGRGERSPPFGTTGGPLHRRTAPNAPSLNEIRRRMTKVSAAERTPRRAGGIIPLYVFNTAVTSAEDMVPYVPDVRNHTIVSPCGKSVSLSHPLSVMSTVSSILMPPMPGRYTPGSAETTLPADSTCSDLGLTLMD